MSVKNLWGDLPEVSQVRSPDQILREQAEELTRLTNGLIVGLVIPKTQYNLGTFKHALILRVPTLNNYTTSILEIGYGIGFYPVDFISTVEDVVTVKRSEDEAEFVESLGKILSSEKTRRIIKALLAHVQSNTEF